jgi:2,5-diamino-6-(ribosylamino)-4(3H)-pyrimidinone 5'-phosphate reductase
MLYKDLKFPSEAKLPYFYSNFVATIDGKVQVLTDTDRYWPLGSRLDYETLIELRTYADVLIHGSRTALAHPTLQSLSKPEFHKARKKAGKSGPLLYIVITNHPSDTLMPKLKSSNPLVRTLIITAKNSPIPKKLESEIEIVRIGKNSVDLSLLPVYLAGIRMKHVLVEGGPTLMGSFFKENLINEVFLTLAPKVVGNKAGRTLSMVEDYLYPPDKVPSFDLISCKQVENELYLRYRVMR